MARKPADQTVNREAIILAAAEVLQRNGYETTTMKDIAALVHLTAASLYHHFRNKDSLLLSVLEDGLEYVSNMCQLCSLWKVVQCAAARPVFRIAKTLTCCVDLVKLQDYSLRMADVVL